MSKSSLIIGIALSLLFLYLYDTGRWPAMVAAFETGAMPPASTESAAASSSGGGAAGNTGGGSGGGTKKQASIGNTFDQVAAAWIERQAPGVSLVEQGFNSLFHTHLNLNPTDFFGIFG